MWERRVQLREGEAEVRAKEATLRVRIASREHGLWKLHTECFRLWHNQGGYEGPCDPGRDGTDVRETGLEQWLSRHNTCPIVRDKELQKKDLLPNGSLKRAIDEWRTARLDRQCEILEGSA
jgi:hypothetical protein